MHLKDYLNRALKEGWALPHFNISDAVTLAGICEAAKESGSPVLIGTSEGERKFIGSKQALAMVKIYAEEYKLPLFLNADHHKSVSSAGEALEAGYESVHIDMSVARIDENIGGAKKIVLHAKSLGKDISVEGEVGYLVTESSKVYKEKIEIPAESLTKPEEAERFVKETGVDRFAPAVGNLHGIAANEPRIDLERIEAIRSLLGETTIVLHGGSGIPDSQIKEAIRRGINNIHVSTELRVVYADALRRFLHENPDETTPYKFFKPIVAAVKEKAAEKIKLFGSGNRI